MVPPRRAKRSRTIELYSERRIRSEHELLEFIEALDEDEGVRVNGSSKNHANGGWIFIGHYEGGYCVNLCDKMWSPKLRKYVTGGNDRWIYFDTSKEAFDYVRKFAKRPLRAWLY